ncbi:aldehyde dehydrogenase family protein [Frankia gtarii]|uniref:aldehyde dehydrogenase family protein n=1 Tax=Frankia gtarii TaxID=2950102 RepID=UPI0021BE0A49|nr:aldehyde dehydrogenase family protein [Frankia gtarii]
MAGAHDSRLLIDGKLVGPVGSGTFDNINPFTEEVIGPVPDGSAADMKAAISAARRAFDETDWSTDRALRQRCLTQLADALDSEREELRGELVEEVGCPVAVTYAAQLDTPLEEALRWPAKYIDEFPWERDLGTGTSFGAPTRRMVAQEPVGVVGAIVPWNFPLEVTLNKLGPALATGNTVVLKAAPDTPYNALRVARLAAERTDLPPGVLNVVTSSDHLVGEVLTLDPRVDLISFTGSTATGRRIMEKGAPSLKRLFLELGGKSAQILLDDADLDAVLPGTAFTCIHAGQGCAISTRLLVPRARYAEALEKIKGVFEAIPYGDPADPGNIMGPLVSARQRERVLGYIEKGRAEGATLVTGGARPAHLDTGWFVEPTVFGVPDNRMTIAQEEIFGPVLCVIAHDGDDDAVRIANESEYGLAGGVVSASFDRAMSVARRVRAGVVGVNGGLAFGAMSPFGGFKQSGIGRQGGLEGFEQYTETKAYGLPV